MKCDGPSQVPCRGCRQSGQRCIFEARSRPKSTSTIPSRPPHFFTGSLRARPGTPTGAPGFYPAGAQPAPPITSRNEPYALRNAREPMPPPPTTSISVLANHPPQPPRPHSPPPSSAPPHPYHEPPPLQLPTSASTSARPPTTSTDSRLGNLESAVHSLTNLPSAIASIQASLNNLQRSHDYLTAAVFGSARGGGSSRARETLVDVPEAVWENYRSRAWPLTPWLVGLREAQGLSGLVVGWLGRRTTPDSRREGEMAVVGVAAEVGRLVADRVEWMKEEIRALGVLA